MNGGREMKNDIMPGNQSGYIDDLIPLSLRPDFHCPGSKSAPILLHGIPQSIQFTNLFQ